MAKIDSFLSLIGHYKYFITIVVGVVFVGFLSENSIMNLVKLDLQKGDLQTEIDRYRKETVKAEKELQALRKNPNAVEKVARERYFMKRPDEDVFVLSTEIPVVAENETANAEQ